MAEYFKDKVVIVTGSSSGIGEAIAILFASKGAKVTLCGRDQDTLKSAYDKAVKASGDHKDRFVTVLGDLNDQKVRNEILTQTVKKFGRLDILVANAGVAAVHMSIDTINEETYNKIMDTNVKSTFFLIQQAVQYLEKTKGNIVIMSTNLSTLAIPFTTVYTMSKAALDHLTNCLAVDLGPKGIRVNALNPGYIGTKLGRDFGKTLEKIAHGMNNQDFEKQAIKERYLTVEDVARVVAFVASDDADYITGEHIKVDGGRSFSGPIEEKLLKH